jgi:hypothetical protein
MTYAELKERQQEEVNKLPLFWAFNESQWKQVLLETCLTEANYKKHLVNYHSAIVRKVDIPMIEATMGRHRRELEEAMKDIEFFKSAVLYEMRNHEYGINWQGDWDVINALGFTVKYSDGRELVDCPMSEEQKKAYREVRQKYYVRYGDDL